jgi:alkylation response protein AidB-like acyl-CoA dehydrogenase
LPFFTLVGTQMAGFPLGVARRAIDELAAVAASKHSPGSPLPISHDGDVQIALARAEGALQAARAFVVETLGALWETAQSGDVPGVPARARFLLAVQQAMRTAVEVVTTAVGLGGSAGMHADHPLQRCLRDIHAADQHIYFSQAASKRYAMARLGIDQDPSWF